MMVMMSVMLVIVVMMVVVMMVMMPIHNMRGMDGARFDDIRLGNYWHSEHTNQ